MFFTVMPLIRRSRIVSRSPSSQRGSPPCEWVWEGVSVRERSNHAQVNGAVPLVAKELLEWGTSLEKGLKQQLLRNVKTSKTSFKNPPFYALNRTNLGIDA